MKTYSLLDHIIIFVYLDWNMWYVRYTKWKINKLVWLNKLFEVCCFWANEWSEWIFIFYRTKDERHKSTTNTRMMIHNKRGRRRTWKIYSAKWLKHINKKHSAWNYNQMAACSPGLWGVSFIYMICLQFISIHYNFNLWDPYHYLHLNIVFLLLQRNEWTLFFLCVNFYISMSSRSWKNKKQVLIESKSFTDDENEKNTKV